MTCARSYFAQFIPPPRESERRKREERATFAQETWPMATQENATSQFTLPRRKSAQPASRIFNYFIHLLAIRWPRKLTALATPLLYLFSFRRSPPFRSISLQFSYFQKWNNARAQRAKGESTRCGVLRRAAKRAAWNFALETQLAKFKHLNTDQLRNILRNADHTSCIFHLTPSCQNKAL